MEMPGPWPFQAAYSHPKGAGSAALLSWTLASRGSDPGLDPPIVGQETGPHLGMHRAPWSTPHVHRHYRALGHLQTDLDVLQCMHTHITGPQITHSCAQR